MSQARNILQLRSGVWPRLGWDVIRPDNLGEGRCRLCDAPMCRRQAVFHMFTCPAQHARPLLADLFDDAPAVLRACLEYCEPFAQPRPPLATAGVPAATPTPPLSMTAIGSSPS